MYQEERLYQIMNLLRKKKSLSKQEIMSTFNISRDTARRDIICLVEQSLYAHMVVSPYLQCNFVKASKNEQI
jgi:DeoR/GlpR family transcriptional regulator of sugar metabolism